MMIPASFHLFPGQERKFTSALQKRRGCRVNVLKKNGGKAKFLIANRHFKKFTNAPAGSVVSLPFKHEELMDNMRHSGGFLPLLAAALAPVLGGVAGGLIERGIAGAGCSICSKTKIKKSKKKKKNQGSGMRLNPYVHQM